MLHSVTNIPQFIRTRLNSLSSNRNGLSPKRNCFMLIELLYNVVSCDLSVEMEDDQRKLVWAILFIQIGLN